VTISALPLPLVVKLEQLSAVIVTLAPRRCGIECENALANAAPATNDVALETNILNMLYSQRAGWAISGPSQISRHFAGSAIACRDCARSCQAAMTLYLRRSAQTAAWTGALIAKFIADVRVGFKKAKPKFRL
jgi:hypothetical protein